MKSFLAAALALIIAFAMPSVVFAADGADYALNLAASGGYAPESELEITVTLDSIKAEAGITFVSFELFYDTEKAIPVVKNNESDDNLSMETFLVSSPGSGWEAICRLDESKGCYDLSFMTFTDGEQAVNDADIRVSIRFVANKDAVGQMRFYIGDNRCAAADASLCYGIGGECVAERLLPSLPPEAPVAAEITMTSVTLVSRQELEYKCSGNGFDSGWVASPIFVGLAPGMTYSFFARVAADAVHAASPASPATEVTMLADILTLADGSPCTIDEDSLCLLGIPANTSVETALGYFANPDAVFTDSKSNPITQGIVGTGMIAVLYGDDGIAVDSLCVIVDGDVSGNGAVNASDCLLVKRHILGIDTLSGAFLRAAALFDGNTVTVRDYLCLKRRILVQN